MRPVSMAQSFLECPLNEVLGTTASVRLLRILVANQSMPVGLSDLARDTGLTLPGARKSLQKLLQVQLVQRFGGPKSRVYALDGHHWLTPALIQLFAREQVGHYALLDLFKQALEGYPEIDAAWLEEKPLVGSLQADLHVLVSAKHAQGLRRKLQSACAPLEQKQSISVHVVVLTHAEMPDSIPADSIWLWGALPIDHQDQSARSAQAAIPPARWNEALAALLERKPSLISKAKMHIERLLEQHQGMANHDLKEWHSILSTYSLRMLQEFLNMESERADRLRRSAPFFPVLSSTDKVELLKYLQHDL